MKEHHYQHRNNHKTKFLALENLDKFFEYMFRSPDEGTLTITMLRYSPLADGASKDARFAEILRRIGIKFSPQSEAFGNLPSDSRTPDIEVCDILQRSTS